MLNDFADIREAIDREPDWYDAKGTPRYAPFRPDLLDVYDKWALLAKIECQDCGRPFLVGEGWSQYDFHTNYLIRKGLGVEADEFNMPDPMEWMTTYHYGDPPRHGCVGDTMNCVDREIVEAWEHTHNPYAWVRLSALDGLDLTPDWALD